MASRLGSMFENLSERERKLVAAMGGAFALLIVFLALFFVQSSMADLEDEAEDVQKILQLLDKKEEAFLEAKEEMRQNASRGRRKPKPLRTLVDRIGKQVDVTVPDMKELPDQAHGTLWLEHAIELSMRQIGLAQIAKFMEEVEKNRQSFPIAITKLEMRKRRREEDSYDVKLVISTYEQLDEPMTTGKRGAAGRKAKGGR